ncbi:MAG: hypothetical protein ACI9XO_004993 [Paraglaciecola sp.]
MDATICQRQIILGLCIDTDTILIDTLETSTADILSAAMSRTLQTLCYADFSMASYGFLIRH